ncbi:MAG: ATP synthase F1 subunit epsilon [Vampirovibrionales bacterium]|nr:ATP synthase F1 subunit epsilon [Vampirovibrionales bacterium]
MTKQMQLKVLTPEKTMFEGAIESLQIEICGEDEAGLQVTKTGERLGIFPGHQPMICPLVYGIVAAKLPGQTTLQMAVMGGQCHTDGETVTILSNSAELGSDLNLLRAQEAKNRAEARLKEQTESLDVTRAEQALHRALTRIKLSELLKMRK